MSVAPHPLARILLDEPLSPWLVARLQQEGRDVVHIQARGYPSRNDVQVLAQARAEGRVLITLGDWDFSRIAYSKRRLHARANDAGGIIVLHSCHALRASQLRLVRISCQRFDEAIASGETVTDHALHVEEDGSMRFECIDLRKKITKHPIPTTAQWRRRLREERRARGWTQGELGKLVGVRQATISLIESGDIEGSTCVLAISAAMRIPPPDVSELDPAPDPIDARWRALGYALKAKNRSQLVRQLERLEAEVHGSG